CGSPWTLAAYMIEGQSKQGFALALSMLKKEPNLLHQLLSLLATAVSEHLKAQIEAGADLVMIFDTWAEILSTEEFEIFSLAYIQKIIKILKNSYPEVPIILFAKGSIHFLEKMTDSNCDVIGIDQSIHLALARRRVDDRVTLQGNMDPQILCQSPD